jgi:hypothetical protein
MTSKMILWCFLTRTQRKTVATEYPMIPMWTPDSLKLMAHHGIDPDSLENDEYDDEGDDDELEPGEFPTRLSCQHFRDSEPLA